MRIKGQVQQGNAWLAVGLSLLLGALLGAVCAAPLWRTAAEEPADDAALAGTGAPVAPASNGAEVEALVAELPVLHVTFADRDWQQLVLARERALERGMIVQREQDIVPVQLRLGDQTASGRARLKGDWLDHVRSEQWSLRFELHAPLAGMRRFSIQHPKTRGFVMEWMINQTARREGLLAPACQFVTVRVNDQPRGLYYLEEHFAKELLESQGRRDGPIVRFDESAMWATWLQYGFHLTGKLAPELERAGSFYDARIEAFGEKRLYKSESLNARLLRSLHQAHELQLLATRELPGRPLRQLQALQQLEGKSVEDVFAVDKLGHWLALYTLYGAKHGLAWHQYRFYHDPVLDRLEPIVFDSGANWLSPPEQLALSSFEATLFRSSDEVMAVAFAQLGRMTEPAWVEQLAAQVRPQLDLVAPGMHAIINVPGVENLPTPDVLLRERARALHGIVRPRIAANFRAEVVGTRTADGADERMLEAVAWATTDISTQVSGFKLRGGRVVSAASAVLDDDVTRWADGAVLLPRDGRRVRFRFPVDRRIAGLADIEAIKRAVRSREARDPADLRVDVLFRPVSESQDRTQRLLLRHTPTNEVVRTGRPVAPTIAAALAAHPFLQFDLAQRRLLVPAGTHVVVGDLVVPAGVALHVLPGAHLQFAAGCVLLCDTLRAEGTAQQPIRFAPQDEAAGFAGVQVVGGAAGDSVMRFVEVHATTAIARGGWQSSGGVTFYRAPVTCFDCTFRDARCEDSLNIVGVRFRLERCTFDGGPHDLFDGDFVDGELHDCTFRNSGEDAFDVSGTTALVQRCAFDNVGDKALSVGEGSDVAARDCQVQFASIAACAKDRSQLLLFGLQVARVENFVIAAYEKKAAFGPASVTSTGLRWTGEGDARHLAQTGSRITLDGADVAPQPVDVERLYRERILGK